jgi:hypothetical protein
MVDFLLGKITFTKPQILAFDRLGFPDVSLLRRASHLEVVDNPHIYIYNPYNPVFKWGYSIYIHIIIMMGYIEYRIDSFGPKKHFPESVKKTIHIYRIKASSEIGKKLYIEYEDYPFSIREKDIFPGF